MARGKVIISCAITGAIHTPSMSPYLPVTAEEIAESAVGAAEAGAAIAVVPSVAAAASRMRPVFIFSLLMST